MKNKSDNWRILYIGQIKHNYTNYFSNFIRISYQCLQLWRVTKPVRTSELNVEPVAKGGVTAEKRQLYGQTSWE